MAGAPGSGRIMGMGERWAVLEHGSDWLLTEWRGHLLGYWTGAVNHHGMRATSLHLAQWSQKQPSKRCAYLCFLLDGFHLPDGESRGEMIKLAPKLEGKLHGFGIVVAGKGFKGAAIRGFITSVAQLSRVEFPLPTFENLAQAEAWFRPRVAAAQGSWGPPGELDAVDAEIRAAHFAR